MHLADPQHFALARPCGAVPHPRRKVVLRGGEASTAATQVLCRVGRQDLRQDHPAGWPLLGLHAARAHRRRWRHHPVERASLHLRFPNPFVG